MRKYPIGIQDFRKIREGGFLYIDKTELIHNMINSGNYYFLSRPRRFGKSLLLSTLREVFSGSKQLFEGLWIENNWDWEQKHPVIHLKLSQIDYQKLGLYEALSREMDAVADELQVSLKADNLKGKFRELIKKASSIGKVVLLVDEYDKPIIDYLDDLETAEKNRDVFKNFYSVIKDADPYLRFVLITGVSKFARVSIFSDLNNLRDITLSSQYSTLAGITQEELESNFSREIEELQTVNSSILEDIKKWYNGYSWNTIDKVYNPFSLLNFMADRQFGNFWFATGTPTFLIEQIQKRNDFSFEEVQTSIQSLEDFNIQKISPVTLLFQTGYLTIRDYDPALDLCTLVYPNREVKASLLAYLLSAYRDSDVGESSPLINKLHMAFRKNDLKEVVSVINTAFSSVPYELWRNATELHYHALVHLTFSLLGVYIQSEAHTSNGRCDALVKTNDHIYVLEFKLDEPADVALQQIIDKDYFAPYDKASQQKIAIGISFSSKSKKISEYKMKEL